MPSQIVPSNTHLAVATDTDFAALSELLLSTVSASSARIYAQTLRAWQNWCTEQAVDPMELTPRRVLAFLASADTTKATRQRQLSALRKLAQMRFILTPGDDEARRLHEALKVIKAPAMSDQAKTQERARKALTPAEADKLLRQWDGETPQEKRNRALVAVLLLAGLRRAEAAALLWADVDFEHGVLTIRHGKRDKARSAPLAGEFALEALQDWKEAQPEGYAFVFTPMTRGGQCSKDRALTGTDVYRIWAATCKLAGIQAKPHDARRTFITEALTTGTPISTVQQVVGHERGDTTLRYAQTVDARRAKKELKLRYG